MRAWLGLHRLWSPFLSPAALALAPAALALATASLTVAAATSSAAFSTVPHIRDTVSRPAWTDW